MAALVYRSIFKFYRRIIVFSVVVSVTFILLYRARYLSLQEQEARKNFLALIPEHLDSSPVTDSNTCGCVRSVTSNSVVGEGSNYYGLDSSCDSYATARGPGQNVVSYSFYGPVSGDYSRGIEENLKVVAHMYPGWVVRVYHSADTNDTGELQELCQLWCNYSHLDFCQVGRLPPPLGDQSQLNGMVWRFFVLGDGLVDRFVIRDLDSIPLQREVDAVQDWIVSNATWHFMHDHPLHNTAIMGGMWGGTNRNLQETTAIRENLLKDGSHSYLKGYDQTLLLDYVYASAKRTKDFVRHDSFLCARFDKSIPFPTRRRNGEFVGSPQLLPGVKNSFLEVCPEKCRPKDHLDWIYC